MSNSWPLVPLGNVLTERCETPSPAALASGEIPIVSKIGFNDGKIQLRSGTDTKTGMILAYPGDLVVSGINAAKGAIAVYGAENAAPIAATIHYGAYIPNPEKANVSFLWWLLRSNTFREALQEYVPGGVKTELKAKRLLPVRVPMPPTPEQQRIVGRIEELAGKIERARELRRQALAAVNTIVPSKRASILQAALKVKSARFDEVALLERGKFSYRPRNDPRFFGGNHPWIQIAEIEASQKYIRHWKQTLNDDGLAVSRKFPKGTLLVSIAATIGSVGILDFDCCVPDSIVAVTPLPQFDSEFLFHYLGYLRTHLEQVAPHSAQKNINLSILAPMKVPSIPMEAQRCIVAELDYLQAKVDMVKALQAQTQAELDALLPSLLDRAFRGEL